MALKIGFGHTLALLLIWLPCAAASLPSQAGDLRSPYAITDSAPAGHWRQLDPDHTLYLELPEGRVVIELLPAMAPANSENIRALASEGFYQNQSIYRVVDGFVAQGGGNGGKVPRQGQLQIEAERFRQAPLSPTFFQVTAADGFAASAGYWRGFPIGVAADAKTHWMLHCPGAFALARQDATDSGGSEFYVVLGHAPRYLDRNVTVFGMVRSGMPFLQSLRRGPDASGQLAPEAVNPIVDLRLAADVPVDQRSRVQVMRTDSSSFAELVASRRSRPEPWFVVRPDFVDVCGVPAPVRLER